MAERRLASRVIGLSAPTSTGTPPLSPDLPDAVNNVVNGTAASAAPTPGAIGTSQPLLGIFSGRPMPDWPVPPPIFATNDRTQASDDELFQRWVRWVDG